MEGLSQNEPVPLNTRPRSNTTSVGEREASQFMSARFKSHEFCAWSSAGNEKRTARTKTAQSFFDALTKPPLGLLGPKENREIA
jgi:hypothetical protein